MLIYQHHSQILPKNLETAKICKNETAVVFMLFLNNRREVKQYLLEEVLFEQPSGSQTIFVRRRWMVWCALCMMKVFQINRLNLASYGNAKKFGNGQNPQK